jgi:glutamyl-Q tRNA(Asp) synthetase
VAPPANVSQAQYVGRFAPSPTGPLHFGSLVAALASYVDARHYRGQWLVRIEDLDPPREQVGASKAILGCLEAHHLFWDDEVLLQSQRLDAYADKLEELRLRGLVYPCYCTRKDLVDFNGPYPGICRHRPFRDKPHALRLLTSDLPSTENALPIRASFSDELLGHYHCPQTLGDFILKRKDGLFAYQFAVVVDDIFQGVTHVIRGMDLIDSTPSQIFLFERLSARSPYFGHIPVALNDQQQKLSKQHGALPLISNRSADNLRAALHFLNHPPPPEFTKATQKEILQWAIEHWDRKKIPRENAIPDYR